MLPARALDYYLFSNSSKIEFNILNSNHTAIGEISNDLIAYCVNNLNSNGDAENDLGILYCIGNDFKQDYSEAEKKFNIAIELGNAQSYFNLGVLNHYKLLSNSTNSLSYFYKALERGVVESNYYMGLLQAEKIIMVPGHDLASDRADAMEEALVRAVPLLKKSAKVNHLLSLKKLGSIYKSTLDIEDTQLAMEYYLRAATLGDIDSMLISAQILIDGYCPRIVDHLRQDGNGYIISGDEPRNLYRNWLNSYHDNLDKVTNIRKCYQNSTKDVNGAIKLLRAAMVLGSGKARAKLADIYFRYFNDASTAIELCEDVGFSEDVDCLCTLARLYELSDSFRNKDKSLKLYNDCIDLIKKNKKGIYFNRPVMIEALDAISRLEKVNK